MHDHRKVRFNYLIKVAAFQVFDRIPFGEKIYYWFQKHVTKTQPRQLSPTNRTGDKQIEHMMTLRALGVDPATATILEIGAGWDLYACMIYYCFGFEKQIAIDYRRWARAETINAVIRHLQQDPPNGHLRLPSELISQENMADDLMNYYGVQYLAPFDASDTRLAARSVDVILTTSVLEHIPIKSLARILPEFRRIIREDGWMRHTVDYSDHYSHADPSITDFNLLRFSEATWRWLNPGIHNQNRLRTRDYLNLFTESGAKVEQIEEWPGEPAALSSVKVHPMFDRYNKNELLALGATFLLKSA